MLVFIFVLYLFYYAFSLFSFVFLFVLYFFTLLFAVNFVLNNQHLPLYCLFQMKILTPHPKILVLIL